MWNFLRFELNYLYYYGLCFIVMCFFGCCMQCLRMYWCNFHYNCVRIYTTNCATFCVLACLVLFTIYWMRNIENQAIARITRDAQHRQRRPLKNGWITTTNCPSIEFSSDQTSLKLKIWDVVSSSFCGTNHTIQVAIHRHLLF